MLVALAHEPKQAMWTGADDPERLFWFIGGLWMFASKQDRARLYQFHETLYQKYGRDNSYGWYKSLNNHTGNGIESVRLYYRELCAYFPKVRANPAMLPR